jgi:hypothetical protein
MQSWWWLGTAYLSSGSIDDCSIQTMMTRCLGRRYRGSLVEKGGRYVRDGEPSSRKTAVRNRNRCQRNFCARDDGGICGRSELSGVREGLLRRSGDQDGVLR